MVRVVRESKLKGWQLRDDEQTLTWMTTASANDYEKSRKTMSRGSGCRRAVTFCHHPTMCHHHYYYTRIRSREVDSNNIYYHHYYY